MSKKNKLQRFAELGMLPNVYQNPSMEQPHLLDRRGETVTLGGSWAEGHFGRPAPIVLELACGKGDYTLALAREQPDKCFIGIDLKGNRLWKGATTALSETLGNVAFIRSQIEFLSLFFAPGEVSEIWITFPDPYSRPGKARKRLTSPRFLELYRRVLCPGGIVHLKTDDDGLYAYTLETLAEENVQIQYQNDNIYAGPLAFPELAHRTYYERGHLAAGKTIKYVRFVLS
jgi:tRNA (guanine-N7-)-methyltransferase